MIAKGAQRVRAHERPALATMNVAAAWDVAKNVENMARAKKVCAKAQAWGMRCLEASLVFARSVLLDGRRSMGRAMLVEKATMAKRKLAKVP